MIVAVYGTLKRGYSAHKLMGNSEFIGETKLVDYALYSDSGLPVIVPTTGSMVECEVYNVSEATFEGLSRYEGFHQEDYPGNLYNCKPLKTTTLGLCSTFIYNGSLSDKAELITDGVW